MAPAHTLIPTGAPASEPAERAVLGAVLLDPPLMPQALELLTPDHFSSPRHRAIWKAMLACWEERAQVDLLVVRDMLDRAGDLERAGGIGYLAGLDLDLPDLSRFETYLDVVEERRVRRAMWEAGHRLVRTAQDGSEDARVLLSGEQERLNRIELDRGREGFHGLDEVMGSAKTHLDVPAGEATGIATGFARLDDVLMGWQPGQLIYLAGRPGMGKSVLASQLAVAAAKLEYRVGFFSLEMSEEELALRMLSAETGVLHSRIRGRYLHSQERERLEYAAEKLAALPLHVDETAGLTPQLLAARAMRHQREKGLDMVVVDYVQLITPGERSSNENEAITQISRALKIIAKRLSVPVLALSQLSRRVEERGDKRPVLSDLRASGSLEQDADTVLFVYRPGYYDPNADAEGEAEVIIAKQRGGRTGIVKLHWQGDRLRFLGEAHEGYQP